jgi:hypothetical protein
VRPPANVVVFVREDGSVDFVVEFDEGVLGLPLSPEDLTIDLQIKLLLLDLFNLIGQQLGLHILHEGGLATILFPHITKINHNLGYLNFITFIALSKSTVGKDVLSEQLCKIIFN